MLTNNKEFMRRNGEARSLPMASGAKIYRGAMVVLEGSVAKPGRTATGLKAMGVAETGKFNDGADGQERVQARRDGWFPFKNSATDPLSIADTDTTCYIEDDETVAKTDGTGTRSEAGIFRAIQDGFVWIEFK